MVRWKGWHQNFPQNPFTPKTSFLTKRRLGITVHYLWSPLPLPPSLLDKFKARTFCLQLTALSTCFKLHLKPSSLNNSVIPKDSWEIKRVMLGSTSVIPVDPYIGDDDTCCFHAFQLLVCSEGLCFRLWLNEWLHHCVCWTNYCVWVSERKKREGNGR